MSETDDSVPNMPDQQDAGSTSTEEALRRELATATAALADMTRQRDDYKGRNEAEYYRNEDLSSLLSETAKIAEGWNADVVKLRAALAEAEKALAVIAKGSASRWSTIALEALKSLRQETETPAS